MKTIKLLIVGALAVAGIVLGSSLLGSAYAQQEHSDAAAFQRGAKAWSETCAHCHNLRGPKEFRDDQWRVIVYHMRIRAGLTGQDTRDILQFLQGSN
jgi:mono/diheme cytochrome c family protein